MLNKIEQCPYQIKVTVTIKLTPSVTQNEGRRQTDSSGKLKAGNYSIVGWFLTSKH